jgi:hypothetical protein
MTTGSFYCPRCGTLVDADCDFCTNCGAQKRQPAPQAYETPPPRPWMAEPEPARAPPPHSSGALAAAQYAPPPQVHHVVYQPALDPAYQAKSSGLPTAGMTMGIITISLMVMGLIPCLGWLNWFTLLFGGVTKILCWVAIFTEKNPSARNKAIIGLVLTVIALFIGSIRLILGGGCI